MYSIASTDTVSKGPDRVPVLVGQEVSMVLLWNRRDKDEEEGTYCPSCNDWKGVCKDAKFLREEALRIY